jgi:outer membrane protein TolC
VQSPLNPPSDLVQLFKAVARPYLVHPLRVFRYNDTSRLYSLIENGAIRLSAHDAIVLALENNLDIASSGLSGSVAESDIKRAASGQLLRNVPTGIVTGPAGASGPLAGANSSGYEGINGQSGVLSGLSVQLAGSPIPQLDPVVYATGSYSHTNEPLANQIVTGTNSLISQSQQWQAGVLKSFLTGTSLDMSITSLRLSQNAPNNTINPATTADLALRIQQPLLQGANRQANMRAIHIARNDRTITDLAMRQQVATTVSQVLILYYDLVAFHDQLDLARKALGDSTKLLEDDRRRLDMGTIPESDVAGAQAEVDANRQLVDDAEIQIQQQELTLKSALTRNGLEVAAVVAAPIIPTDHFAFPDDSASDRSIEEVANRASRQRTEIKAGDLQLENTHLSLLGTREALKPTLNVYMNLQSNALAGRLNPSLPGNLPPSSPFIGGVGSLSQQLWTGSYPDYEFGFQLNLPLTNRAAQADMMRDQIDLEQRQISLQQVENSVRLQAMRSQLALRQAKKFYESSVHLRELRETNLVRLRKMFDLGTSDVGQLMDAQTKLELIQQQEITARNTYVRAIINLDMVLDETLEKNHIVIDNFKAVAGDAPDGAH